MTHEEVNGVISSESAIARNAGDRLAASYVNFILPNGAVIFPTFGDEYYDVLALRTLQTVFPDREIVPFYSREILLGGGNIHCITQHQPLI